MRQATGGGGSSPVSRCPPLGFPPRDFPCRPLLPSSLCSPTSLREGGFTPVARHFSANLKLRWLLCARRQHSISPLRPAGLDHRPCRAAHSVETQAVRERAPLKHQPGKDKARPRIPPLAPRHELEARRLVAPQHPRHSARKRPRHRPRKRPPHDTPPGEISPSRQDAPKGRPRDAPKAAPRAADFEEAAPEGAPSAGAAKAVGKLPAAKAAGPLAAPLGEP